MRYSLCIALGLFVVCFPAAPLASADESSPAAPVADRSASQAAHSWASRVWANSGEDKVARDDLRAQRGVDCRNSLWDGGRIRLFGSRNETVSFNLVLESAAEKASQMGVRFLRLVGPEGAEIASRPVSDDLFDFRGRDIELFYVRYLKIEGLSRLAIHHYDERHVPARFRRPHDAATGDANPGTGWSDRPDHDKDYPDIAVPLELHPTFDIRAGTNQSIWCDVTIPRETTPGIYQGEVEIAERGTVVHRVPVQLEVIDFSLPDEPTAKTMLYMETPHVNRRYLGEAYPHDHPGRTALNRQSRQIIDNRFKLAKRHGVSLITEHVPIERMESSGWEDRLSGELFVAEKGYAGRGVGIGNGVFSIGTYGAWKSYFPEKKQFLAACRAWGEWFESHNFSTPTDVLLYLEDESNEFTFIEERARWVREANSRVQSFATLRAPDAVQHAPSLDIACSTPGVADTESWRKAVAVLQKERRFWMYNGFRPASGTLTTEDDGVALRQVAWGQFKFGIERWFMWESVYYVNSQAGTGPTNVFASARTYGGDERTVDPQLGKSGYLHNNGDGVLFYPGTDRNFPNENYGIDGPIASLRLKHWRRGLQDAEYLAAARQASLARVDQLVKKMCPRIFWEIGVSNPDDPTYVRRDISWPTDPDAWEGARRQLAELIRDGAPRRQRTDSRGRLR